MHPFLLNMSTYMQLYFYDTDNEIQNRTNMSSHFVQSTLIILMDILKVNPYSRFFRSLSDITNLDNCLIRIRCDP